MLTTVDKVKLYMNLKENVDDDFIKQIIKGAQNTMESICNRKFESDEYTEIKDCKSKIITNNFPIQEVASLTCEGVQINKYKIHPTYVSVDNKVRTLTGMAQSDEEKEYTITYTAGYDPGDMPQDLVFACTKLSAYLYKEAREDRLGVQTEKIDVLSSTYLTDIPQSIMQVLKAYRKVNL